VTVASRRLEVIIAGDAKGAQEAFDQTQRGADTLGSRMMSGLGDAGKAIGVAGAAAVVGIGIALKGAYDAAVESQKIANETERVIRTTGGAAGVTAQQVSDLATSLSEVTGVDDEVIQSTENLILTFTNVKNRVGEGNDVFTQATKLALDMATALGTDSKDAAIQLGKALNDPIKGITALSRSGVSFTEAQKEQIKTMVKSGDVMGAQKVILKELATEFGGAAEAAATPWEKLSVKLGNFQEQVGAELIPIVDAVVGWVGERLPAAFDSLDGVVSQVVAGLEVFSEAWDGTNNLVSLSGFTGFMENLAPKVHLVFDEIRGFVDDRVMPILSYGFQLVRDDGAAAAAVIGGLLVAAFAALAAAAAPAAAEVLAATWPVVLIATVVGGTVFALVKLWQSWDTLRDVVGATAAWLQANVPPAFETIKTSVVEFYNTALAPLVGYISANREQLANVGKILLVVAAIIVGVVIVGWVALVAAFTAAIVSIGIVVTAGVALVAFLYNLAQVVWDVFNNVRDALGGAWEAIENFVGAIPERLGAAWTVIASFFAALPGQIGAALAALPGVVMGVITFVFDWATTFVGESLGRIVAQFLALPGLIMGTAAALWGVIQGIWSFVTNEISVEVSRARDTVVFIFTQLPGMAAGALASLWGAISGAFFTAKDQSVGQTSNLVSTVTGFLASLPGRAAGALSGFAGAVTGALSSAVGAAASIGGDIVRGVANGITGSVGFVIDAAKRAASNIINGFKSALGISSPSKVMADQVGQWIPAGVALGIQEGMGPLLLAARNMTSAITGAARPPGLPSGLLSAAAELQERLKRPGWNMAEDFSWEGMSDSAGQWNDMLAKLFYTNGPGRSGDWFGSNATVRGWDWYRGIDQFLTDLQRGAIGPLPVSTAQSELASFADAKARGIGYDSGFEAQLLDLLQNTYGMSGAGRGNGSQQTVHINVNVEQGYVGSEDGLGRVITRHLAAAERAGVKMPWATVGS
jgi:phage-related protein